MKRLVFSLLILLLPGVVAGTASAQGFGAALAVSDDAVFVSEPNNAAKPGLVYVFQRDGATWTEAAQVGAMDGTTDNGFGSSLDVDGRLLVVGAPGEGDSRGAVYVFEWDAAASLWRQAARLSPEDVAPGDNFGIAVAASGNVILAGAYGQQAMTGAAYVFEKDAMGNWMQQAKLMGSTVEEADRFGVVLDLEGDTAFIAATRHNNAAGAVYVFRKDGMTWTEVATLSASGVADDDRFGSSITLSGDAAFIGAPRSDRFTGVVYAYRYDAEAGEWNEEGSLVPFDGQQQYRFATAMAADGNDLWVGAPGAAGFSGTVYALQSDEASGTWKEAVKVTADEAQGGSFFAGSVSLLGDVAVAGIPGADYGAGRVAVFERDGMTGAWQQTASLVGTSEGMDPLVGGQVDCSGGTADAFDCKQVDLVSFLPVQAIGGGRGVRVNDLWGWTDPETGKEWAIVGRMDGTAFVDVSDPLNPVYVGNLPRTEGSPGSTWRDMKVYKNFAFIVADGAGAHGMQIFDLTQLRDVTSPPVEFNETAHYDKIHSAHNIVINEDTGFAYTVGNSSGGETCGGGSHIINIQDPLHPTFAGCFAHAQTGRAGTGYTHDAQCVTYHGPDAEHRGKEICFGANETALSIADVTDKQQTVALASASYPNVGYSHQGWLTEDHRYFFMNDELDELGGNVTNTRTLIWDVSDLDDPQLLKEYLAESKSSDHNLYIKGNFMYQSNYVSGLRVFDITDVANPVEVGYFDTVPEGENVPGFNGSWSNYPFFESGIIVVTSGQEGMFILKKRQVDI